MLTRAKGSSWPVSRLGVPLKFAGIPAIVPVLKAYSGFGVAGPTATARTLGRIGALEVRLARNAKEIRRAQKLRYQVFFEEGGATTIVPPRWSAVVLDHGELLLERD